MLMRFDPFRDFDRFTQALTSQGAGRPASMPMDAYREGDNFIVQFDLPGRRSRIDRPHGREERADRPGGAAWQPKEGQEVLIVRAAPGHLQPPAVPRRGPRRRASIEAAYNNGVLPLTIPVAEQAKPRKVEITAGQENRAIPTSATES